MAFGKKPLTEIARTTHERQLYQFVDKLDKLQIDREDVARLATIFHLNLEALESLDSSKTNKEKLLIGEIQRFRETLEGITNINTDQIMALYKRFILADQDRSILVTLREMYRDAKAQLPNAIEAKVTEKSPELRDRALALTGVTDEIRQAVSSDQREFFNFWDRFFEDLPLPETVPPARAATQLPVTVVAPLGEGNYFLDTVLTSPRFDQVLTIKRYQFLFAEDPRLEPLLRDLENSLSSVEINNPVKMRQLFSSLDRLNKKIQSYCKRFNKNPSEHDVSECYQALKGYLPTFGIELLDLDPNKITELVLIYSGLQHTVTSPLDIKDAIDLLETDIKNEVMAYPEAHVSEDENLPQENRILDPKNIQDYLKRKDIENAIRQRARDNGATLMLAIGSLCQPANSSTFKDDVTSLQERKEPDKIAQSLNADVRVNLALGVDSGLKAELLNQLKKIRADSDLERQRLSPQTDFHTFAELRAYVASETVPASTDQARFLHQVARVRYTLDEEELRLLSTATGMNLRSLKPENYLTTINDIQKEIDRREGVNGGWFGLRGILFPERTTHLQAAKQYLEYNLDKRIVALNPEDRLQESFTRKDFTGQVTLNNFLRTANSLSGVFGTNRAIHELSSYAHRKAAEANKLKKDFASSYWKHEGKKKIKHEEMKAKLSTESGRIYQPEALAHNFVAGKDHVYNGKLSIKNYFIAAPKEEHNVRQVQEQIKSGDINKIQDLSVMEITQAVYLKISDIMLKNQETESFAKAPPNLESSPDQLVELGQHLETAKNTHKELKQAVSTFSQLLLTLKQYCREAENILAKLLGKKPEYIVKDLEYQLERLENLYQDPSPDDIRNCTPKFMGYVKNNQLTKFITDILDEVQSKPDEDVISQFRQSISATEKDIDQLHKKFFNRQGLQKVVDINTKNVEALTYIINHTTEAFGPNQP